MTVRRTLMAHQQEGLEYALRTKHPAFFMEMRLGKTLLTIRWVQALRDNLRSILIVAPKTVLEAWERELEAEGECFIQGYDIDRNERLRRIKMVYETRKGRRWLLINYEALRSIEEIAIIPWDVVILDESTRVKTTSSKLTKICTTGFRECKHRAILTGLPTPESDLEIYEQMKFLDGQFMNCKNFYQFRNENFELDYTGYGYRPKRGTKERIRNLVQSRCFVKTRKQCSLDKEKIYEVRKVEMSPIQKKMYEEVEEEFAATLLSGQTVETNYAVVRATWMAKLAGGFDPEGNLLSTKKVDELISILNGELRRDQVVVWFRMRNELLLAKQKCIEKGITNVAILGGSSQSKVQNDIRAFRMGSARVLLATEQKAKFGVDASTASVAIYYSNDWSGEARAQSEERILNVTKDNSLLIIDLVTAGTVDEDVLIGVRNKVTNAQDFMVAFRQNFLRRVLERN